MISAMVLHATALLTKDKSGCNILYSLKSALRLRLRGNCSNHHHQSLNHEGRWGTTDDFATSFLHFPLFSTALWDLANSGLSIP